jgi:V/A-type H+-transporting ATPase subunit C
VARLDFTNARIGARRARLVGASALRELLARGGLEARLDLLRATAAGARIPTTFPAGVDPTAAIEAALRAALRRDQARAIAEAEGARARALLVAYVGLDAAAAVKAVARGVWYGTPLDLIFAAAPETPELPARVLRGAAATADVAFALDVLAAGGSAVAKAARVALAEGPAGALLDVEIAADRAALAQGRAACRGRGEDGAVLARHLADLSDVRNAETLLALAGAPPARDPFVEGGRRLSLAALRALAAVGDGAAVRAGVATALHLPEAALARGGHAEGALERAALAPLLREARLRPLSIAVPLAWLFARRAEVRRIALLLRGAALGLAADEVLDLAEA